MDATDQATKQALNIPEIADCIASFLYKSDKNSAVRLLQVNKFWFEIAGRIIWSTPTIRVELVFVENLKRRNVYASWVSSVTTPGIDYLNNVDPFPVFKKLKKIETPYDSEIPNTILDKKVLNLMTPKLEYLVWTFPMGPLFEFFDTHKNYFNNLFELTVCWPTEAHEVSFLEGIVKMNIIKRLRLTNNGIKDPVIEMNIDFNLLITSLSKLFNTIFSNTRIEEVHIRLIRGFDYLIEHALANSQGSSLESIQLHGTDIYPCETMLESLDSLKNLKTLHLMLSYNTFDVLKNLPPVYTLKHLNIGCYDPMNLLNITVFANLETLYLNLTGPLEKPMTDTQLGYIGQFHKLKRLNFHYNEIQQGFTFRGLAEIGRGCRELKHLDIIGWDEFDNTPNLSGVYAHETDLGIKDMVYFPNVENIQSGLQVSFQPGCCLWLLKYHFPIAKVANDTGINGGLYCACSSCSLNRII